MRLYFCIVDFQKALDFIIRQQVWYKLCTVGIRGEQLEDIHSL